MIDESISAQARGINTFGRTRGANALLAIASTLLSGCAVLPERVAIPLPPRGCIGSVCQLAVAKTYAWNTEAKMMALLKQQRDDRDALRALTFIGAIATAGVTSFGGGRDLTVGLGLVTGASAITSSLTTDRGYANTYLAAADASACVAGATATVESAAIAVQQSRPLVDTAKNTLLGLGQMSPVDEGARDVAVVNADIVLSRTSEFDIAGTAFAWRSQNAVDDIVTKARQQIAAQEPDQNAFRNAISLVGGLAVAPPPKDVKEDPAASAAAAAAAAAPGRGRPPVTSQKDKLILASQQELIARQREAIDAAINRATTDAPAQLMVCGGLQAVAAVQPLTVSGTTNGAVTIGKDTNVSLALSGGEVGYRSTWVGTVPKDLTLSQQGNTVDVSAGSTIVADKAYTLRVYDLATKSQSKDIVVNTK